VAKSEMAINRHRQRSDSPLLRHSWHFTIPVRRVAGSALLDGADLYAAARPGVMHFDNWFMDPLPAAIAGATFAWLPIQIAGIALVCLTLCMAAWALTGDRRHRLPVAMSAPAL
jgi:hypothetical protein